MEYDISEASRLFGISPSGLRYYEEIGLIAPRHSESGRRKYSGQDLQGLMFLRYMRSLGVSMEETREYFHYDNTQSLAETGQFMLGKVQEAREKAEYYAMLTRYLENHGNILLNLKEHLQLTETMPPEYYLLTLNPAFGKGKAEQEQVAKWIDAAPVSTLCTIVLVADGVVQARRSGLAIRKTMGDRLSLPLREKAEIMPSLPSLGCIYTTIGKENYGLDDEDVLDISARVEKLQGWKHIRIVSRIFHTHLRNGVREKFYRIWVNPA